MDHEEARTRLLDAAESLFYERGVQAVGMDELRAAAGVSLKRLYQVFPAKRDLVADYLRRRDRRWLDRLATAVRTRAPEDRPLAVFDWLAEWFAEPGFRGCAFINSVGELGPTVPEVRDIAGRHKQAVADYLAGLLAALPVPDPAGLAAQFALLVDGAITGAAITGDPAAAGQARAAAAALLKTRQS